MEGSIRTRYAPSPTGPLHMGGARTALFNYLFAKHHGGAFALRIEDTDVERSERRFESDILESLGWLGISADEGPGTAGYFGPYRQSERLATYRRYLASLMASGRAGWCAVRTATPSGGYPVPHRCDSHGGFGAAGEGIIRFRLNAAKTESVTFEDMIRGRLSVSRAALGDFSIAKNLDAPLYNFAVVVDDHEMRISHVIRGEDHLPNTPKQLLLQEALGFSPPGYAHLPLILGTDRAKLSKRHGATAVREFRDDGYLPEAIVNFLALLGWNPGDDREFFTLAELVDAFDIGRIQKGGAAWNAAKLDWFNGEYLRRKRADDLARAARPYLTAAISNLADFDEGYVAAVVALEQPRLKKLSELADRVAYFFQEPTYERELLRWKRMDDAEVAAALRRAAAIVDGAPAFDAAALSKAFLEAIGEGDRGAVLWPLRVALTGRAASPGPFEIMEILGRANVARRIQRALEKLA